MDKIEYLCKSIPKVEWSGILFYEVKGSVKNLDKMRIICKDILLMNKGNKSYTEYEWDEDVVSYMMDNPEAIEWKKGHIHSHNTMSVFFSGTDMSELEDNCPNHNIYFSLIVNNFLDMQAKLAIAAYLPLDILHIRNEKGDEVLFQHETGDRLPYAMYVSDCEIIARNKKYNINKRFSDRLVYIEQKAEKEEKERAAAIKKANMGGVNKSWPNKPTFTNTTSHNNGYGSNYNRADSWGDYRDFSSPLSSLDTADQAHDYEPADTVDGKFLCYILRLATYQKNDSIEAALEDLEVSNISASSLAETILENYSVYYSNFFEAELSEATGDKFIKTLDNVIELLKVESEGMFECYAVPICTALKGLKHNLKLV